MAITTDQNFTIDEYLEREVRSLDKHEYHNGKIIKRGERTTTIHNQLALIVGAEILMAVRSKEKVFQVYNTDMKIWIEVINRFLYPGAVAVTLTPEYYNNQHDIITNPSLIVEITSGSTGKFNHYRSIPIFSEYLLVNQERHHVARFYREAPDLWRTSDYYNLDEMIPLQSMGLEISMMGIYKGVDLNP